MKNYRKHHVYRDLSEAEILADNMPVHHLREMFLNKQPNRIKTWRLSSGEKAVLLRADYELYSQYLRFEDLSAPDQLSIALRNPKVEHLVKWDELSSKARGDLTKSRPSWFRIYPIPRTGLGEVSWKRLIKYHKMFEPLAVRESPSGTDLRKIIKASPDLLPGLTIADLQGSKLNSKEWVLLLNYPEIKKSKYTFSPEAAHHLDSDILFKMVSGAYLRTKPLDLARAELCLEE